MRADHGVPQFHGHVAAEAVKRRKKRVGKRSLVSTMRLKPDTLAFRSQNVSCPTWLVIPQPGNKRNYLEKYRLLF